MLQVDLVRHRARAGLDWDKEFLSDLLYFMLLIICNFLGYSTFDNYNSVYNYGFWIIVDVIKFLNFPCFLGK